MSDSATPSVERLRCTGYPHKPRAERSGITRWDRVAAMRPHWVDITADSSRMELVGGSARSSLCGERNEPS